MKYGCFFLLLFASLVSNGQNLIFDNTFPPGAGANNGVHQIVTMPDGRYLLGGTFQTFGSFSGRGLIRLWPNGQRDVSFNVGTGVTTRVQEIGTGPNGRVYVGGLFTSYNGTTTGDFVCLDSSGTIDPAFAVGTGFNNEVTALGVYPNGDIVVGGFFTQYNGVPVTQPVKILANGQRDMTFNPGGTGTTGIIDAICIQHDQKILVAGSVNGFNGQSASRLIRLNPDGSRDSSFNLSLTISGPITDMCLTPSGHILIGGSFTTVNGVSMVRIARLLSSGQLDPNFTPGTGFNATVRTVYHGFEGQVLVGGDFTTFNGQTTSRVAILDTNGNLQYSSGNCAATNGTVFAIRENPDQTVIIGGVFTQVGGSAVGRIARILRAGTVNAATAPVVTASNQNSCSGHRVILNIASGTLNGASHWRWYSGACGGTSFSSSTTVSVYPTQTTTYYARGEGDCVSYGPCDSITVVVQDTVAPVPNTLNLPVIQGACGLTIPIPLASDNCIPHLIGAANRSRTFTTAGEFTVIWTYTDTAGNSTTQTQTVIVDSIDTRIVYNSASNTLSALNASAAYQWVRCDLGYQPIPGATTANYPTTSNGDFAVIITENACVDTSDCITLAFTGVQDVLFDAVQLYPNPTRSRITVLTDNALLLRLYDARGRKVFSASADSGESQLQLPNLPTGLYYWEMEQGGKLVYRKQLIE